MGSADMTDVADGPTTPRVAILGMPLDPMEAASVRSYLRAVLEEPWDGRCRHIVTLNPEYVMAARRDRRFAVALRDADLVVGDGIGVVIAARLLGDGGAATASRVTGVDLVEWLAAVSGPADAPVFFLGAGPGVADAATAALRRRHPGTRVAGSWAEGSATPRDDASALDRIAQSKARAVLVAYGAPGQVIWIARNQAALAASGVRLAIGVGGAMDYVAGIVPRAPLLIRFLGLEWLYRLIRQPWRWRRQLVLPRFAALVLVKWLWQRGNRAQKHARLKSVRPREERQLSERLGSPDASAVPQAPLSSERCSKPPSYTTDDSI